MFGQEQLTRAPRAGMSRYQVSSTDDASERAAESAADHATEGIFRSTEDRISDPGGEVSLSDSDLSGPGSALPSGLQNSMEKSLGSSFSNVRVHTDEGAARASDSISAEAFTKGSDIYFSKDAYSPDTAEGQHTIAHELAHVAAGDTGIHRDPPKKEDSTNPPPQNDQNKPAENKTPVVKDNDKITEIGEFVKNNHKLQPLNELETETNKPQDKDSLDARKKALNQINQIKEQIEQYQTDLATIQETDEVKKLKTQLNEMKARIDEKDSLTKQAAQIAAVETLQDGETLPETVTHMMDSPFFDAFMKAVDDVRKESKNIKPGDVDSASTKAFNERKNDEKYNAELSSTASNFSTGAKIAGDAFDTAGNISSIAEDSGAGNDAGTASAIMNTGSSAAGFVDAGSNIAMIHNKEAMRQKHMKELGVQGSTRDDVARTKAANSIIGASGNAVGAAGGFVDDKSMERKLGVASSSIGAASDIIGVGTASAEADQQRKQDARAKESMRSIATQLSATIGSIKEGTADDKKAIDTQLGDICKRIKGDKFNPKDADALATLISNLLNTHKNHMTDEQNRLLGMLASLEASRASSKSGAKDAIKEAIKAALSFLGDASSLVGAVAKHLTSGSSGKAASIVGAVISTGVNLWNAAEDTVGAASKSNDAREKRDAKVDACRNAIISMASLPDLDAGYLKECRTEKKAPEDEKLKAAEQHAAVFNIIESANVEMQDILYAIKQGFGDHTNKTTTLGQRMDNTAGNLSFSNLEV